MPVRKFLFDNPTVAKKLFREAFKRVDQLGRHPKSGKHCFYWHYQCFPKGSIGEPEVYICVRTENEVLIDPSADGGKLL